MCLYTWCTLQILYMCKRETFKQLAGEQCKVICGAWASKHTYITVVYYNQSFVGLWTHNGVWKCLVHVCVATGVATGGLCRPAHLNSTEIKVNSFSWDVVRCGGGGLFGVSERGGVIWVQGSHSLGEKAVEQSGGAGSDTPVPSTWG